MWPPIISSCTNENYITPNCVCACLENSKLHKENVVSILCLFGILFCFFYLFSYFRMFTRNTKMLESIVLAEIMG